MTRCHKLALALVIGFGVAGNPSAWAVWGPDGVAIATGTWDEESAALTPDGAGGAIIVWVDNRSGSNANCDIYARRVTYNGWATWASGGVAICTADMKQDSPALIPDGSGGAIIVWQDQRNNPVDLYYDIYAQRIDASGAVLWAAGGVPICTASGDQRAPSLIPDGSGGAIITWYDYRDFIWRVYAQRIDPNGSTMWTVNGIPVCPYGGDQLLPRLTSDGSGGAIICWHSSGDIYAQRLAPNGAALWAAGGVAICAASGTQHTTRITSDGSGGAVVAWLDYRSGSNYDIYARRVDANGSVLWDDGGVAVCTAADNQSNVGLVPDGSGGAIIIWQDPRAGGDANVYAQRIDANGSALWAAGGVAVCAASGGQYYPQAISDGAGGALVTWSDSRNVYADIYAQRIDSSGSGLWTPDGNAMCTADREQFTPRLCPDSSGGAIIVWDDYRSSTSSDVYVQRVDAAGHTVIATLLQAYSAAVSEVGIVLTWTLSEIDQDVEFFVGRACALDGPYVELPGTELRREGLSFSYVDGSWEAGKSYWYRVELVAGRQRAVLFEAGPVATPLVPVTLFQNHPNPFNPSTEIRYYLPKECDVALDVYDVRGALVARLAEGNRGNGLHMVSWDGRDNNGRQLSSGVYFYRLKAGKIEISKKMVLAR